ncbi:MAG: aminotransferase class I/II-fold pyridoxal phosphate-dependent enzyme [Firmicutes bacterium]|nr:aminotransferase class I/II-fold pyridoxal phosphate-dependent enzyme [Bacillota bacterium]
MNGSGKAQELRPSFVSDYMEGAHPEVMRRLLETNLERGAAYGADTYSESARAKIRLACNAPDAQVFFLSGGTQTNAVVIDTLIAPYQGVIAAASAHINTHEAGAVEYCGHKVISVPQKDGKLRADQIRDVMEEWLADDSREHVVMPGIVYISHPTELGTLYSLDELTAISDVCRRYGIKLYLDGARLAYALGSSANDVTLPDIAELCDAFYIGGAKCGALFGEAAVFPRGGIKNFITILKQHGALFAKGKVIGTQFDALFTDGLYWEIGRKTAQTAERLLNVFASRGVELAAPSPTNQIFVLLSQEQVDALAPQVGFSRWARTDDGRWIVRFVVNWATAPEEIDKLAELL